MLFSRDTRRRLAGLRSEGPPTEGACLPGPPPPSAEETASDIQSPEDADPGPSRSEGPNASLRSAAGAASGPPDPSPPRPVVTPDDAVDRKGRLSGLTRRRLRERLLRSAAAPEPSADAPPSSGVLPDTDPHQGSRWGRRLACPAPTPGDADPVPPTPSPAPEPPEVRWGGECRRNAFGECLVLRTALGEVCAHGPGLPANLERLLAGELPPDLPAALADPTAGPLVLLDIETGGLSSAPVFLVGLLEVHGGRGQIVQLLARDYSEEAALLAEVGEGLARSAALFTYNGATFDLPFLHDRAIYHSVPPSVVVPHVDLLPRARRRYRGELPDCRLQTLESCLCGRERVGDVPGDQIPQRYHDFVRLGDAALLDPVLEHNRLDLVTLLELAPHLLGAPRPRPRRGQSPPRPS